MRYYIAFLKGDRAGMEREAARDEGNPEGRLDFPRGGFCLGLFRSFARGQAEIAPGGGLSPGGGPQRERAAMWEAGAAVREAFFGNRVRGKAACHSGT